MNIIDFLTMAMLLAAGWSIICRVRMMSQGQTRAEVIGAHFALFAAISAAVLWPAYGRLVLGAGLLVFVLLGAHRWRHGAPEGTRKPETS